VWPAANVSFVDIPRVSLDTASVNKVASLEIQLAVLHVLFEENQSRRAGRRVGPLVATRRERKRTVPLDVSSLGLPAKFAPRPLRRMSFRTNLKDINQTESLADLSSVGVAIQQSFFGVEHASGIDKQLTGYELTFLIATLPDLIDSGLGHLFNAYLAAIERSAEAVEHVLDRIEIPWSDKGKPAATLRKAPRTLRKKVTPAPG
jgi:hypothetical protein